jgi:hypothetical protein
MTDIGVTIKENVNKLYPDYNSIESIEWALKYTNSTKKLLNGLPGGAGLSILEKFIEINSGRLHIISDKGFFERIYENSKLSLENVRLLDYKFPGTIITLEINIDNEDYIFIKENDDIYKILQEVLI